MSGILDTDVLRESQGIHGGHIFPGASMAFPTPLTDAPWEQNIIEMLTTSVYVNLSNFAARSPLAWWWSWERMQNGEYDALEGINKWIWFYYMAAVFPNQSFIMNINYYYSLLVSQFLSSYWFKVTSANTFFWLIFAPDVFAFNWEQIEEEGEPINFTQATAAHYWGYTGETSFGGFLVTYIIDLIIAFPMRVYVLAFALFGAFSGFVATVASYPQQLIIMFLTPWDEHIGEDLFIWYFDAIELGLYDPMDPPRMMFDYEPAREHFLASRFPQMQENAERLLEEEIASQEM